jgi:hypothetical protein
VAGAYHTEPNSEAKTYFRLLKGVAARETTERKKVREILGSAAFQNLAMRAVVDGDEPAADSPAGALLAELREALGWAAGVCAWWEQQQKQKASFPL